MITHLRWGVLAVVFSTLGLCPASEEPAPDQPIPANTCVLELDLPAKSIVTVQGKDHAVQRSFTFSPLQRGLRYEVKLQVKFPSGRLEDRSVFVRSGQRIGLALQDPDAAQPELVLQTGHTKNVKQVAFTPDGRYAASATDSEVILWERATGRRLRTFSCVTSRVHAFDISPDGRRLAVSGGGFTVIEKEGRLLGDIRVWDIVSGAELVAVENVPALLGRICFSPDGRLLAAAGELDRSSSKMGYALWESATGRLVQEFRELNQDANVCQNLDFSPDGTGLLVTGLNETTLHDLKSGQRVRVFAGRASRRPYSPDGRSLVTLKLADLCILDAVTGNPITTLYDVNDDTDAVALSPDGQRAATASGYDEASQVCLWDAATGAVLDVYRPHTDKITAVAFSPDGSYILTGSEDKAAVVWDVKSRRIVHTLRHDDEVRAVAFSPDGKTIGTCSDNTLLWDARTGQKLRSLGSAISSHQIAFSPDGRQLLVEGVLWDAETGKEVRRLQLDDRTRRAVAFSPRGDSIFTGGDAGDFKHIAPSGELWNAQSGELVHKLVGLPGVVEQAAFSADGRALMTLTRGVADPEDFNKTVGKDAVVLWDVGSGKQRLTIAPVELDEQPSCAALSADGRSVFTGGTSAHLWDGNTGRKLRTFRATQGPVGAVALSPDGRWVARSGYDYNGKHSLMLWDLETGRPLHNFGGYSIAAASIAFSPDGKELITSGPMITQTPDEEVHQATLWDVATGQAVRSFRSNTSSITNVHASPDGRHLVMTTDQALTFWDLTGSPQSRTVDRERIQAVSPDGEQVVTSPAKEVLVLRQSGGDESLRVQAGPSHEFMAAQFSPDGRLLAISESLGNLTWKDETQLWNTASGRLVRRWQAHTHWGWIMAFSPDGRLLATGGMNQEICLWDTASGRKVRTLRGHEGYIGHIAFSPDGRYLLSSAWDRLGGVLWDLEKGRMLRRLESQKSEITCVAFGEDSRLALTGDGSGLALLWDSASGQLIGSLRGHESSVTCAAFAAEDARVMTGSDDGTLRIWEVATARQLAQLVLLDDGRNWAALTPEGLFDGSAGGREQVTFRVGGGLEIVPVERFFQNFYQPGLLSNLMLGDRPLPTAEFGLKQAPLVRIVEPQGGSRVTTQQITLKVEVTDRGGGIQGPWLRHNGARILAQGTQKRQGKILQQQFQVALVEGPNRLEVQAASDDGSWESEPAAIELEYGQPLPKSDLYLLAVGVNRYAQESLNLKFAAPDARAIAELFLKHGPAFYGEGKVHIASLLDEQATRAGIESALERIAKQAKPQDTLVVYLAGHGAVVGQRYYFIPHEFKQKAEQLDQDIREQGLPGDVVNEAVRAVPTLKRVQIYDTCQSGGTVALLPRARSGFAFRGAMERLGKSQGGFILAATAATADAQEVPELGHGVLTYALLAAFGGVPGGPLKTQAIKPSGDEVVDIRDWFNYAQDKVPALTKVYLGQEQFVSFSGQGTSFPILPLQ